MRILYLDDSGKIHANHDSTVAVFGGFSIDEGVWHRFVKQVNGAKAYFYPMKPKPYEWEIKSTDFLTANAWKPKARRGLCSEVVRILRRNDCRVYAVTMEKSKAVDTLEESKFVPLAFQRLVAKFNAEVVAEANTGSITCDWSNYPMDHHISNCVTSMVITNGMFHLRGGVTYGSSSSLVPLQVADLIAGTIRRSLEGQRHLNGLAEDFRNLRMTQPGILDVHGYPIDSILKLF